MILPAPIGTHDLLVPARRRILKAAAASVASMAIPALAQTPNFWDLPRELWLYRPDTKEEVRAVYWANGELALQGYVEICRLLRDIHINQAVQMDLVTLDIARGVYGWLQGFGISRPLIINSGFRSIKTNANEGGKKDSLHTKGQAIDLRIDGVSTESVAKFGLYLAGGGVGFYPGKQFTHLDRGSVRFWRG